MGGMVLTLWISVSVCVSFSVSQLNGQMYGPGMPKGHFHRSNVKVTVKNVFQGSIQCDVFSSLDHLSIEAQCDHHTGEMVTTLICWRSSSGMQMRNTRQGVFKAYEFFICEDTWITVWNEKIFGYWIVDYSNNKAKLGVIIQTDYLFIQVVGHRCEYLVYLLILSRVTIENILPSFFLIFRHQWCMAQFNHVTHLFSV